MPTPDLIHVIFNGGSKDESHGIVSLRKKRWLFYTWGRFFGHHAREDAGVITVGIDDDDFKLLRAQRDQPKDYLKLANWDHVVEVLLHPKFRLPELMRRQARDGAGDQCIEAQQDRPARIEVLVVVKGGITQQQLRRLERSAGSGESDVTAIGGNTDVLFHTPTAGEAKKLAAKLRRHRFVQSVTINKPAA